MSQRLVQIASGVLDYPDLEQIDSMIMELRGSREPADVDLLNQFLEYRSALTA